MKLIQDFGVRALLASIASAGMISIVFYTMVAKDLAAEQLIALVAMINGGWMMALGFYFGLKESK